MNSTTRDTQKLRVYRAGWALAEKAPERLSLEQARDLVDRALAAYGEKPIARVGDGRRARVARGGYDHVTLPRWSRTTPIVLHEAAHVVMARKGRDDDAAPHGPEYARVFVDLLRRFSGLLETDVTAAFRAQRVRIARTTAAPAMIPATTVKRLVAIRTERHGLMVRLSVLREDEFHLTRVAVAAARAPR